jgi:hypothetical protein
MNGQLIQRRLALVLLAALALTIPACCITTDNPLSDLNQAKVDEKLLGTWEAPGSQGLFKTFMVERLALRGYPPGAMKLTLNPADASNSPRHFVCFGTELNGKRYAHICLEPINELKRRPTWNQVQSKGFNIYKYEVSAKTLTLWGTRNDVLQKAVEAGKLKGKWEGGSYYRYIRVTDTTANLARFLASVEGDEVFYKEGELKRVK